MANTRANINNLYKLLGKFNTAHGEFTQQVGTYHAKHASSIGDQILNTFSSFISSYTTSSSPSSSTPLLGAKPSVANGNEKEKEKETTVKLDRWLTSNTRTELTEAAQTSKKFINTLLDEQDKRKRIDNVLSTSGETTTNAFTADMKAYEATIDQAKQAGTAMLVHLQYLVSLYPTLTTYANNLSAIVTDATNKTTALEENVAAFQAKNLVKLSFQPFVVSLPTEMALATLPVNPFPYSDYYDLGEEYFKEIPFDQIGSNPSDPFQQQMEKIPADSATTLSELENKLTRLNDEYKSIEWENKFSSASNIQTEINDQPGLDFDAFNKELTALIKPLFTNKKDRKDKTDALAELNAAFDTMQEQLSQQATITSTTIDSLVTLSNEIPNQLASDEFTAQELINDITELQSLYFARIWKLKNARESIDDNNTQCAMSLIDRFKILVSKKTFREICDAATIKSNGLSWEIISGPVHRNPEEIIAHRKARRALLEDVSAFIKNTSINFSSALEKTLQTNEEANALQSEMNLYNGFIKAKNLISNHSPHKLNIQYTPKTIGSVFDVEIKRVANSTNNFNTKWLTSKDWIATTEKAVTTHYQAELRNETLIDITSTLLNKFRLLKNCPPAISINDSVEYAQIVTHFNELIELATTIFDATKNIIDNEEIKAFLQKAKDKTTTSTTKYTQQLLDGFQVKFNELQPSTAEIKAFGATAEELNTPQDNKSLVELFDLIEATKEKINEINKKATTASKTLDSYFQSLTELLAESKASLQDIKTYWLDRAFSAFENEYEAFIKRETKENFLVNECERWLPAFEPNFERLESLKQQINNIRSINQNVDRAKEHHDEMTHKLSTQLNEMLTHKKNKLATIEQFQRLFMDMQVAVVESLNKLDPENPISRANTHRQIIELLAIDSRNWRLINKLTLAETPITPRSKKSALEGFEQLMSASNDSDSEANHLNTKIERIKEIFSEEILNRLSPLRENQEQISLELDALNEARKNDEATLHLHNQNIITLDALISSSTSNILIPSSDPITLSSSHSIPSIKYEPLPFESLSLIENYKLRIKQLNNCLNNVSAPNAYDFDTFKADLKNTLQNNQDPAALLVSAKTQLSQAKDNMTGLLKQVTSLNTGEILHLKHLSNLRSDYDTKLFILKRTSEDLKLAQTEKIKNLQKWIPLIISYQVQKDEPLRMLEATAKWLQKIRNDWKNAESLAQVKYQTTSDLTKIEALSASTFQLSKKLKATAFALRKAFIQRLDECDTIIDSIHKNAETTKEISAYWTEQEAQLWDFYFIEMEKIEGLYLWLLNIDASTISLQEPIELQKATYDNAFELLTTWNDNFAAPFLQEYQQILDDEKQIEAFDDAIRQLEHDQRTIEETIALQGTCIALEVRVDKLALTLNNQLNITTDQLNKTKAIKLNIKQRALDLKELNESEQAFGAEKQGLHHNAHVYASVNGVVFKRLHYALMANIEVQTILTDLEGRAAIHKKEANKDAIRAFITAFTSCKTNLSDLMAIIDIPLATPPPCLTFPNATASLLSTAKKPTKTCILLQRLQVTMNKLVNTWETITPIADLENDFQQRKTSLADLSFLDNASTNIEPTPRFLYSYHASEFKNKLKTLKTHRKKIIDDLKIEIDRIQNDPSKDDYAKLIEFRKVISESYDAIIKTLGPSFTVFGKGSNLGNELKKYLEVLDHVIATYPTPRANI